ncbi:hypothetical protein EV182_006555, partial [Spiromyces aspiralis]
YLALHAPEGLRIALGGRNRTKLGKVREELVAKSPRAKDMDIFVADSADVAALRDIVKQVKVVIATVGPYTHHGSGMGKQAPKGAAAMGPRVLEACVKERTDYCDITGEVMWVDRMRQEFGKLAEENGTAVVSFAGFDCVPSDLGTLMLADYARAQYDKPLSHVKASVTRIRGGISDGTLASVTAVIYARILAMLGCGSPHTGAQQGGGGPSRTPARRGPTYWPVHYDSQFGKWQAPWMMASIDAQTVQRAAEENHYGDNFSFYESLSVSSLLVALGIA